MEIKETLEELLKMVGAYMTSASQDEFTIIAPQGLPEGVHHIAKELHMSQPTNMISATQGQPFDVFLGPATYEYVFNNSSKETLRAFLFIHTEKQRYERFCKMVDNEVTEELDTDKSEYNN